MNGTYLFTSYVNHPSENAQFLNEGGKIIMFRFGKKEEINLDFARNIAWFHLNRGMSEDADFFRHSPKKAQDFMVDSLLKINHPLPYTMEFKN